MLSQFKFNLRQALSCILIHQQDLFTLCQDSLEPLQPYLQKILPSNLYTSFKTITTGNNYTTIDQFFSILQELERDTTQFSTPNNKSNTFIQENTSTHLKSSFLSKRKTVARRERGNSFLQGVKKMSFNNQFTVVNEERFTEKIFKEFMKMDGGAKKQASFTEKQLFKETLNYHKIMKFLEEINVRLTPDARLKLLILIKKNSADCNFVKKEQFNKIYKDMRTLFYITQEMENEFSNKRQKQYSFKKNLFSRKLDLKSYRRTSNITRLPSVHQSQKSTVKINPQKLDINQSVLQKQKQRLRDQEFNQSTFLELQQKNPVHRLSLEKRQSSPRSIISQSRTGTITWSNLGKMKQQSNLTKNVKIPNLYLRTQISEDQYYLSEFYKSNGIRQVVPTSTHNSSHSYNPRPYQSLSNIITQQP